MSKSEEKQLDHKCHYLAKSHGASMVRQWVLGRVSVQSCLNQVWIPVVTSCQTPSALLMSQDS